MPVNSSVQIETFLPEIQEFPVFEDLKREQILELLRDGKMKSSRHRETLYGLGNAATSFGLVLRGAYKLVRPTPKGEDVIMYFSSPGDVVAALLMAHPSPVYPVSVISMGPSLVLDIPKRTYTEIWMKNPQVLIRLQNLLFNRMSVLQDHKLLAKSPLNQKVAFLLLQLLETYSAESEKILPIPLTRKEIADSLGSTVESIIRIMSDWSQKGIISTTEQYIEILRPESVVEFLKEA